MKVMLLTLGTRGDVQPYIAMGRELSARGHEVFICTSRDSGEMIEAAGLRHRLLSADSRTLVTGPRATAAVMSLTGRIMALRWAEKILREQLHEMWQIGLDEAPDVILHSSKGILAPHLARKLGGKAVPVFLQPGFAPSGEIPPFVLTSHDLGRLGNRLSHEALLAALRVGNEIVSWASGIATGPRLDPIVGWGAGGLRLHAYSPTLSPPPGDFPRTDRMTGYPFMAPEPWEPPADLAAFLEAGSAPVYVGFGSMPGIDPEGQTRTVVAALRATNQRGIIATGWGGLAKIDHSADIHVLQAAPHGWLFPRVAAVVHHGGSGSTHEGLRWGRPSVVCPLLLDQPYWGGQVAKLGAGPKPIPQTSLTAEALAAAIHAALSAPVRARAAELGETLRSEDGCARIADLVEAL
jgi:sterol 3beta-glucosyltransferase